MSSTTLRFLGWCVHAYTALGLIAAAIIAVLIVQGGPAAFRWCFILMGMATLVDATDGTLARKVQVKKVLPGFDGRRLDDIIDYMTYTFLPILLVWRAQLLPEGYEPWLLLPLLASIYGFCQVEAKTSDGYFRGFPSYWNIVALYLYVLPVDPWLGLGIVETLALFTFVPSKYLYPSQPGRFNLAMTILGGIWTIPLGWLAWSLPATSSPRSDPALQRLALLTLIYPALYMGASWFITLKHWSQGKTAD